MQRQCAAIQQDAAIRTALAGRLERELSDRNDALTAAQTELAECKRQLQATEERAGISEAAMEALRFAREELSRQLTERVRVAGVSQTRGVTARAAQCADCGCHNTAEGVLTYFSVLLLLVCLVVSFACCCISMLMSRQTLHETQQRAERPRKTHTH